MMMMKAPVRLTCLVAVAISLGGCQSFPLTSWLFKKDRPASEADPQLAGSTAGALEEGTALLRAGNLSAAVASFRIAQLDRATRADASNGLGVAYAKLGRLDLAERYFQAAILSNPDNTRYAANLLRLQQQVILARRPTPRVDEAAVGAAPDPQARPASQALLSGTVDRVSRGEVHVTTRPQLGNAPAIIVAYADRPAESAAPSSAELAAPTPADHTVQ
jgi:tetratricopeptide (TPR) repeat protein